MKKVNLYIYCDYEPIYKFGYRCFTLEFGKHRKTELVYREHVPSNVLYLEALAEALEKIKEPCEIFVCSTDDYMNNMVKYFSYYEKNSWQTKSGKSLKDASYLKRIAKTVKEKNLKLFSVEKDDKETREKVNEHFKQFSRLKVVRDLYRKNHRFVKNKQ